MKIVIKIGTSTLTHPNGKMNIRKFENICKIIADLKNAGHEIIIVSSGAIAMGVGKLPLFERPSDMPTKQAAASVGQCELMYTYDKLFSEYNHTVGQILVTASDLTHTDRLENFTNTLERLLSLDVIPIINENNTVAVEEIKIGDNDTLASIISIIANADLLILMSDVDGLYSSNPNEDKNSVLLSEIHTIDENIISLCGDSDNEFGTGGMKTKINAAIYCTDNNCDVIIMNGSKPELLYDAAQGKTIGTKFFKKG